MTFYERNVFHAFMQVAVKNPNEEYYYFSAKELCKYLDYYDTEGLGTLLSSCINQEQKNINKILDVEHEIENTYHCIYSTLKIGYSKKQLSEMNLTDKEMIGLASLYYRILLSNKQLYSALNRNKVYYLDLKGEPISINYSPLIFIKHEKTNSMSEETSNFIEKLIESSNWILKADNVKGGLRISYYGTPLVKDKKLKKCIEFINDSDYYYDGRVEFYKDVDLTSKYAIKIIESAKQSINLKVVKGETAAEV